MSNSVTVAMWFKVIIALLAAECLASPHAQHVGFHRRDDAIKVAEQARSVGPAKISSFVTSAMAPLSITAAEVKPTAAVGIYVPVSLRDEILTAVPPTILLSLMYDDYRTSIRSEFHAGHTPAWYESIKPEVKSFFEAYAKHSSSLVTTATTTETGLPTMPAENSEANSTPKATGTGTATATGTGGTSPNNTGAVTSSGSQATSGVSSANTSSSKSAGGSNAGATQSGVAAQVPTSAASTASKKTTSHKGAAAVATGGSDADSVVNEVQLPAATSNGSSLKSNESAVPDSNYESDSKESVAAFGASKDNETSAPDGSDSKVVATGVENSSADSTGSPYSKDNNKPDTDPSKSDEVHSHSDDTDPSKSDELHSDNTDSSEATGTQAPSTDSPDSATSHHFDTSNDSDESNSPSNATPSAGSEKDSSFSAQSAEDAAQSTSRSGFSHGSPGSFTVSSAVRASTEGSFATSAPDDADPANSSAASPTPSSSSSSKDGGEVVETAVAAAVSINASRWTVMFAMGMAGFLGAVMVL